MPAGSILVADDDAAIRTVLNQALSRAGYEVRSTGNAATLWRWVSQGDGDLVITDVVMPDENAFDLLAAHQESAAGSAGRGHERAEHLHDRDPRLRARRLRISAEAVRSEGADRHRRPRAVGAEGEDAAAGQGRGFRIHSAGRPLAGDAGNLPRAGAADADRSDGDDLGRIRHRQGTGGARAARLRQAPHRAVRRHQHGGDPARPHRIRIVRPREGRLHRRQYAQRRPFRAGRGRHAVPRRDRRHADGGADAAAARVAAGRIHHRRRPHADQDRRAHHRRDQQGSAPADPAGAVPRRPVLPPQRRAAAAAAAARAHRRHSRPDPAFLRASSSAKDCRRSRSTRRRSTA